MMATLVFWTEAEGLARNCEGSMQTNLPFVIRIRELDKNTHIGPFTWHCPWRHNGVGPGGIGKSVSAKASSRILVSWELLPFDWRHAALLKSPAT